jgi:hypothetical protein
MILGIENGRLGNQIFQYFFFKGIARTNEKIFLLGFDDLKNLIEDDQLIFLISTNSIVYKFLIKIKWRIDKFFLKFKIFNFIYEKSNSRQNKIVHVKGIISKITYINGFFQNEKFIKKKNFKSFKIKENLIYKAKKNISKLKKDANTKIIFVHLRGGDFKFWPSKKNPAVLPIQWFIKRIQNFNFIYKNYKIVYILFTNDKKFFLKKNILLNKFVFVKQDLINNFLIMSLCDGGILSSSTYSWWPAFLSFSNNKSRIFFAPKYWIGHRSKEYFPKNFKYSSFLKYKEVNKSDYNL